jgi:hypothetical protein
MLPLVERPDLALARQAVEGFRRPVVGTIGDEDNLPGSGEIGQR